MMSKFKGLRGSIVKTKGLGGSSIYKVNAEVEVAAGPYNTTCLDFGGTNEYASRADAAGHDFTTAMSYSFWVKAPATAATAGILSKGDYTLNTIAFYCCRPSTAPTKLNIVFGDDDTGQHSKIYQTSVVVFDDTWKHVVVTFSAGTIKIYVNGVEDTTPTKIADSTCNSLYNSGVGLRMGCLFESGAEISFLTGKLCSVPLFGKALSAAEVTELYNGGVTTDVSLHSAYADCVSWYKAGDGDSNAANGIVDTKGALHLTPNNMEAGDIGFADAP